MLPEREPGGELAVYSSDVSGGLGTHIALLRGVNVGGRHKLPMRELVAILEEAGCRDVRTYIQSGNAVFTAPATVVPGLAELVAQRIEQRFGFGSPVLLRTRDELGAVASGNPFLVSDGDTEGLHVLFLAARPSKAAVVRLAPDRSPGDAFVVRGREIFLRCPNGVGRTKLTNEYFDSVLGTVSTGRNWRTVLKLLELASGC